MGFFATNWYILVFTRASDDPWNKHSYRYLPLERVLVGEIWRVLLRRSQWASRRRWRFFYFAFISFLYYLSFIFLKIHRLRIQASPYKIIFHHKKHFTFISKYILINNEEIMIQMKIIHNLNLHTLFFSKNSINTHL